VQTGTAIMTVTGIATVIVTVAMGVGTMTGVAVTGTGATADLQPPSLTGSHLHR
jgi:hypothetical protein